MTDQVSVGDNNDINTNVIDSDPKRREIREKIASTAKYLHISRVPDKTYNAFQELSREEFCSDHGMLLKHLLDVYMGLIPTGLEQLHEEMDIIKAELIVIKQQLADGKIDKKKKTRMDGRPT